MGSPSIAVVRNRRSAESAGRLLSCPEDASSGVFPFMPTYSGGRHEHGQNFLVDEKIKKQIIRQVQKTRGPLVEIGPGHGALTTKLQQLNRPLTAVEIDAKSVKKLTSVIGSNVELVHDDFLQWKLPASPYVAVGNLPFHQTTSMLRKILHDRTWTDAILLVQWEVARRRAGVGGASMMTAQWWPWVDFSVAGRVPRGAFMPMPSVDGGILIMRRREEPLLPVQSQGKYRTFVHSVFTGRGNGIANILTRVKHNLLREDVRRMLGEMGIAPMALPKQLTAEQWAVLFRSLPDSGRRKVFRKKRKK